MICVLVYGTKMEQKIGLCPLGIIKNGLYCANLKINNAFVCSLSLNAIRFEEISNLKKELYPIGTRGYGINILCENIIVKDDVLFLLISLKNESAVSYELSAPRFAVESKRRTKRGLQYEKAVFPKQSYGLGVTAPGDVGKMVFTFDKIALTRGQVFRVYFYEKGGARNFVLTLSAGDVNGARRLN